VHHTGPSATLHRLPNSPEIGKVIPFRTSIANDSGGEGPSSGQAQSIGFAPIAREESDDG